MYINAFLFQDPSCDCGIRYCIERLYEIRCLLETSTLLRMSSTYLMVYNIFEILISIT